MIEIEFFEDYDGKEPFTEWFKSLKDAMARIKLRQKLDRMAKGNFGDVEPVGKGVSESKIDYGPGYRIYFVDLKKKILILHGGDKRTQAKDIKKSHEYYKEYKLGES